MIEQIDSLPTALYLYRSSVESDRSALSSNCEHQGKIMVLKKALLYVLAVLTVPVAIGASHKLHAGAKLATLFAMHGLPRKKIGHSFAWNRLRAWVSKHAPQGGGHLLLGRPNRDGCELGSV